jgi:RNA polymerase sigma factor (TIGR02999 family)
MDADEPPATPSREITRLLRQVEPGDPASAERLFVAIYPDLRRMARSMMRRERAGHTLQPTELVHDAFLRLVDQSALRDVDRVRFLGIAGRAMRQVLVDHARRRGSQKRGGELRRVTLDDALAADGIGIEALLELDRMLAGLEAAHPRAARVVELKVFGGLVAHEIADVLGVSKRTVDGDWALGRMWIARALAG